MMAILSPSQAQIVFENVLYNSTCNEEAYTMVPANDGGFIVSAAYTYNCQSSAANWESLLIKLNAQGDTLWTRSGIIGNDFLRKTTDGNYIFLGGTHAGLAYDTIRIVKATETGDTIWTQRLFFPECNNEVYDLVNTSDGGYALCGIFAINCGGSPTDNSFVVKLDANGKVEWNTFLTGPGNNELFVVRQLPDSSYALFGWVDSSGVGESNAYLLRLDKNGDSIFSKKYGVQGYYGYGMDVLPGGGFITIGYTEDSTYALKLDSAGNVLWQKPLGVPSGSIYFKAVYTPDKHYAFIASESDTTSYSGYLFKTDTSGNILWQKNLGGLLRELVMDGPGTFLMAGYYEEYPANSGAYYIRFDTTFNPLDTVTTGITPLVPGAQVKLKYNILSAGQDIQTVSNITQPYRVEVYDLLGRLKCHAEGSGNVTVKDCSNLMEPGLYIWRAIAGGTIASGKLEVY